MSYYIVAYNTSTDNNPPEIRSAYTNFTSFADVTKIQLSWEDKDGTDITGWLFSFEEGDHIEISNADDESEWGLYKIILLNNNTDSPTNPYIELEVAPIQINGVEYMSGQNDLLVSHYNFSDTSGTSGTSGISGTLEISGTVDISGTSGTSGTSGSDGKDGVSGLLYQFSEAPWNENPGLGYLCFNHETEVGSPGVNRIYINDKGHGTGNPDYRNFILTWANSTNSHKGNIIICGSDSAFTWNYGETFIFELKNIVAYDGYLQLDVSYISGPIVVPSSHDDLCVQFIRTGDNGDSGTSGTSGISPQFNLDNIILYLEKIVEELRIINGG